MPGRAFTLIELLIVVAIIAILAAVALPNFLEAQVRSKVTRVRADMRTVAVGLEAYHTDHNYYPLMYTYLRGNTRTIFFFVPNEITTPVAYLSTKGILIDLFKPPRVNDPVQTGSNDPRHLDYYNYINSRHLAQFPVIANFAPYPPTPRSEYVGGWELWSYGPDRVVGPSYRLPQDNTTLYLLYDPTNGTISPGDIRRTQLETEGRINENVQVPQP